MSKRRFNVVSTLLLAVGFVATAAGSVWTILTPVGTGVNFGAAFLYEGGMLVGVIGLVMVMISVISSRREE